MPTLPPVAAFSLALLPNAFQGFVADVAERMQAPPDYIAAAIMVALGSIVAGQVAIRPKEHDDWTEATNLWGGIIGRPGVLKTPALEQALRFLNRLEADEREKFEEADREWTKSGTLPRAKSDTKGSAIRKTVRESGDVDGNVQETAPPVRRRYRTSDVTVERLGAILAETGRNLLVFRDELTGWLRSFEKKGSETARAFYLEAWSGMGSFTYDRISRGTIDIPNCVVSVFGGIQPGPLAEYLTGMATSRGGDDGLMQRFSVVVWPDVPKTWQNVDRPPNEAAARAADDVFRRLANVTPAAIGATTDAGSQAPYLRYDGEAQIAFNEWRAGLETRLRSGTLPAVLESHLSKYRKLVPALSLLLHLADVFTGPVGVDAVRKAVGWAEYLESHAKRVYGASVDPTSDLARTLLKKIKAGALKDGFTVRDVYIHEWTCLRRREQVEPVIRMLCDLGWLRKEIEQKTKPKALYRVNPAAFLSS